MSVERLSEAIECEGFKNRDFGEMTNAHGDNMDEILNMLAYDVARFRGCALIVQYGGDYRLNDLSRSFRICPCRAE